MSAVIDADTHVDESENTWAKLEGTPFAKYIPLTVNLSPEESKRAGFGLVNGRRWLVEDRLQFRPIRDEINHPPRVRRELEDVAGRVKHMDDLGVDIQVVFSTFFIRYGTNNAEAEWALTSTYNRWLADKCSATNGRLQWVAVLPWLRPEKAVEELRWAKEHGACGVFKRGYDLNRKISDPHFFPVYEEANALGLPLCIHTGHPMPGHEWDRGFPIMAAFTDLVTSKLAQKFSKLKFGFIEAGASWIPYIVSQLGARKRVTLRGKQARLPDIFELAPELFRENRAYITIDGIDDIESILKFGTEDNLMIGTDYSHTDISANLGALAEVNEWVNEGKLTEMQAHKILKTNPQAFYGF
jgi:uncharacterized protein